MKLNVIIDINDLSIKEIIKKNLKESLGEYHQITYEELDEPFIIFKEIENIQQLNNFHSKNLPHHKTVFILDKSEYIFDALSQYPLAFIRKSSLKEDLENTIELILNIYRQVEQVLTLKVGYSYIQLKTSQITYIESFGHYLVIHTLSGQYKVREKISHILNQIKQQKFIKIHKSYIVNKKYVKEKRSNEVILKCNTILPIGRKYKNMEI